MKRAPPSRSPGKVHSPKMGPAPRDLQTAVLRQLRRTPWWVVSLGCHLSIASVLALSVMTSYKPPPPAGAEMTFEPLPPDELYSDIEIRSRDLEMHVDEVPVLFPLLADAEISDHHESVTESLADNESRNGKTDLNRPFEGRYWSKAIGTAGAESGAFGARFGGRRNLRAYGGGRRTESAVLLGLSANWFKTHQNPDGMWSCDRFCANCKKGLCTGAGATSDYDVGVTGLALLVHLGIGHTHRHGRYKRTVKSALRALKERQQSDGTFGRQDEQGRWIYNHHIAAMAVAETHGLAPSPLLKAMAQKAVDRMVQCQNPGSGWRYGERPGDSDSSCTGWAVLALRSARLSGLSVPESCFQGARNWFDKATDKDTGRTGYTVRGGGDARKPEQVRFPSLEAMTAAAMASRLFMGAPRRDPVIRKAADRLHACLPVWDITRGTADMTYWYYGTLAMFRMGGRRWKAWESALFSALVPTQRRRG